MFDLEIPEEKYPILPLIAANAIRKSLLYTPANNVMIKWPNDIVADTKKYAGILIEVLSGIIILGVGINIYNTNAPNSAYLYEAPIDSERILKHISLAAETIISDFQDFIDKGFDFTPFKSDYEKHLSLINEEVAVLDPIKRESLASGRLLGVDLEGRLLLEGDDGHIHRFQSQVSLRRRS
jgi:BirA family biotin operon repressor/biotin-[acetyl-CoA-carboxylase] ligase